MFFKQFYLSCLAHASYMIGAGGAAAIVDPQRDVDQYLEEAEKQGLEIRYILETHLHADFVSGHVELAERTGAKILMGARAGAEFPHVPVAEGHEIELGEGVVLRALETPGHTPEGISWLVYDRSVSEEPTRILTGDTLFIGDVGRPDLVGSKGFSAEQMAGMMFDSLHEKILALPDDVEVFPAHGAGSACGRNISSERSSTIGDQKRTNYALLIRDRDEFIKTMTHALPAAPAYFPVDAEMNRRGARKLSELDLRDLSGDEAVDVVAAGAIVLDVRSPREFGASHIRGSVNIGLGGQYASWAGTLLDSRGSIVLVAADGARAEEAVMRLARVGFEAVVGWVSGGVDAWAAAGGETAAIPQITVDELRDRIESSLPLQVIDVRRPGEFESGHVAGALHVSLDELPSRAGEIDVTRPTAVICEGGYRSSIGTSFLERAGVREIVNVTGGTSAWRKAGFELETPVGV